MMHIIIYNENNATCAGAMRDRRGVILVHTAGKLRKGESLQAFKARMKAKAIDGCVEVTDLRKVKCQTSDVK